MTDRIADRVADRGTGNSIFGNQCGIHTPSKSTSSAVHGDAVHRVVPSRRLTSTFTTSKSIGTYFAEIIGIHLVCSESVCFSLKKESMVVKNRNNEHDYSLIHTDEDKELLGLRRKKSRDQKPRYDGRRPAHRSVR